MAKSTRNTGKPWTEDDVRQLRDLARGNTPTRLIGMKLGRTASSIKSKAAHEGLSLKPANRSPYG
jgi:hypothetical protein